MDKYNNGKPVAVPGDEAEKTLAISEWSEGNERYSVWYSLKVQIQ